MEFRLYYKGRLKGNAGAQEKQKIRGHFHKQLKMLWNEPPLVHHKDLIEGKEIVEPPRFLRFLEGFNFVPLVNERMQLLAELDILMLRPEPPGFVITQSGDIDNRLKTLFDSLRMPKNRQELAGAQPLEKDERYFCLLEDDALITKVSVSTDRLYEEVQSALDVLLIILVRVKHSTPHMDNLDLGL